MHVRVREMSACVSGFVRVVDIFLRDLITQDASRTPEACALDCGSFFCNTQLLDVL